MSNKYTEDEVDACSFCGKGKVDVKILIQSPNDNTKIVCNECIKNFRYVRKRRA